MGLVTKLALIASLGVSGIGLDSKLQASETRGVHDEKGSRTEYVHEMDGGNTQVITDSNGGRRTINIFKAPTTSSTQPAYKKEETVGYAAAKRFKKKGNYDAAIIAITPELEKTAVNKEMKSFVLDLYKAATKKEVKENGWSCRALGYTTVLAQHKIADKETISWLNTYGPHCGIKQQEVTKYSELLAYAPNKK